MTGRRMGDEAAALQPCRAAGPGVPTMGRTMGAEDTTTPEPRRAARLALLLVLAGLAALMAGCGGGGDDAPEDEPVDVVVSPPQCAGRAGTCR